MTNGMLWNGHTIVLYELIYIITINGIVCTITPYCYKAETHDMLTITVTFKR